MSFGPAPTMPAARDQVAPATPPYPAQAPGGRAAPKPWGSAAGCHDDGVEGHVDVAPDVRLWVQDSGDRDSSPLLLVMGANASGLIWPDRFLASLAEHTT